MALWHLTDWQGAKKTTSYNTEVMKERVNRFVDKAALITEIQRAQAEEPTIDATLADTIPTALQDPAVVELAYRAAAKRTHPDSGGNTEAFQLLQDAMRLIRQ